MAQELHDGVGHGLAVIAMQAGVGLHVLDRDPAARPHRARGHPGQRPRVAGRPARRAGPGLRRTDLGRAAPRRPRQGVADLDALVDRVRTAGLSVELTGSPGELAAPVDAVVYGVVQEGLTNVLRHAGGDVGRGPAGSLARPVTVSVEDDGQGAAATRRAR